MTIGPAGSSGVGTGGMTTKVDAARIATGAGIAVVLTSAEQAAAALAGAEVGTLFAGDRQAPPDPAAVAGPRDVRPGHADARRRSRTRRGLARRLAAAGRDHRGRPGPSWPATRSTCSTRTAPPWRAGLVNFDADELPALLGRSTSELKAALGAAYEREVIHRDDLVLLG